MKIAFDVGDQTATLTRNWLTGRCVLTVGDETRVVQSPFNPATHFSFNLERHWHYPLGGHDIVIEKKRPLLVAGFRPQTYRIFVDGKLVVDQTGY